MTLDRDEIAGLIPHAGGMCLLDEVLDWNGDEIDCSSRSHQNPGNPLRRRGMLSSVHLVEYAAQSMAIHGALLALEHGQRLAPGHLVALRGVQLAVERIDDLPGHLLVSSRRLMHEAPTLVCEFSVRSGGRSLACGRLTVVSTVAVDNPEQLT